MTRCNLSLDDELKQLLVYCGTNTTIDTDWSNHTATYCSNCQLHNHYVQLTSDLCPLQTGRPAGDVGAGRRVRRGDVCRTRPAADLWWQWWALLARVGACGSRDVGGHSYTPLR